MYKALLHLLLPIILLSACCGEIKVGSQNVDVSPLYELEIDTQGVQRLSDLIDLSLFESDGDPEIQMAFVGRWSGLQLFIDIRPDNQIANDSFTSLCEFSYDNPSLITYGGEGDNRYCISYVVETRNSVEMLCSPTGIYQSSVVFQKQRLVIDILEYSGDKHSTAKDSLIRLLAQEFNKKQP